MPKPNGKKATTRPAAKPADALQRFGVSMEESLLEKFDAQLQRKGYATRSEALRDMVRAALEEDDFSNDKAEAVGTISLVYDHHARNLTAKLTQIQHGALDLISSNLHIHLDAERCLEVLVVRGNFKAVRELAEKLISIKGVKHGKFVTTVDAALESPPHNHKSHLTHSPSHHHHKPATRKGK